MTFSASVSVGGRPLNADHVLVIQSKFAKSVTPATNTYVALYRSALGSDDPIIQFLILYLVLYDIAGNREQEKVDGLILCREPLAVQTKSPHNGKLETIYTRIRNEITHRAEVNRESVRADVLNNLDAFKAIVRRVIQARI